MTQQGSPKRRYDSSKRQAAARATRRQILEAARLLFSERGYAGATIEAIAQEAGVAPETVYAHFGSKQAILAHLIDLSVGGDDEPVSLLERPGPQAALRDPDPRRQLQLFAQDITVILERVAPIFEIMRLAAKTEPEIAELLQGLLRQRLENMAVFIQHLAGHGPLRDGVAPAQAAETVWALSSPELFRLYTVDRGWSSAQYSAWLADALTRILLP